MLIMLQPSSSYVIAIAIVINVVGLHHRCRCLHHCRFSFVEARPPSDQPVARAGTAQHQRQHASNSNGNNSYQREQRCEQPQQREQRCDQRCDRSGSRQRLAAAPQRQQQRQQQQQQDQQQQQQQQRQQRSSDNHNNISSNMQPPNLLSFVSSAAGPTASSQHRTRDAQACYSRGSRTRCAAHTNILRRLVR